MELKGADEIEVHTGCLLCHQSDVHNVGQFVGGAECFLEEFSTTGVFHALCGILK